jgi:uncharacterized protein
MSSNRIDKPGLISLLRETVAIDWDGLHGASHWSRVRLNGLHLSRLNGANAHVIELFALLHDSGRQSEGRDVNHGERGAANARKMRDRYFEVTDQEMLLLEYACTQHSEGHLDADLTVQTCWDADRLDLARVGITPDPKYLCTNEAKTDEVIRVAVDRSMQWLNIYLNQCES